MSTQHTWRDMWLNDLVVSTFDVTRRLSVCFMIFSFNQSVSCHTVVRCLYPVSACLLILNKQIMIILSTSIFFVFFCFFIQTIVLNLNQCSSLFPEARFLFFLNLFQIYWTKMILISSSMIIFPSFNKWIT